jgi:glyoxylase-like metal-dependent hydrolase (beta-lactamase superfamily II)
VNIDLTSKTPSYTVLERGWLSSNSILFTSGEQTAVIDTGYCAHAKQTLFLLQTALDGRALDYIVNTHLHSDHCGGNAALQTHYPLSQTYIPHGSSPAVAMWDEQALSYLPTGQSCPRFGFHHLLRSGESIILGTNPWEIHAAPGHDPDSVILFEPASRTLISADALWENGFGVVFPELESYDAFDEVAATLDLIERLAPAQVIPGHGAVFHDLASALSRARSRLESFVKNPGRHARHAAKVLLKYKILELQRCEQRDFLDWIDQTPYFALLHRSFFVTSAFNEWIESLLVDLIQSKTLIRQGSLFLNLD